MKINLPIVRIYGNEGCTPIGPQFPPPKDMEPPVNYQWRSKEDAQAALESGCSPLEVLLAERSTDTFYFDKGKIHKVGEGP